MTPILPHGQVKFAGLVTSQDRFYLAGIAILIATVLWAYFRFSRLGLATRAASENELGASLLGFSPDMLAGTTWTSRPRDGADDHPRLADTGLNPANYTLFVVPALAVVLVARLKSLRRLAAGRLLGLLQSELSLLTPKSFWPSGPSRAWPGGPLRCGDDHPVRAREAATHPRFDPDRGAPGRHRPRIVPVGGRPRPRRPAAVVLTDGSYRFGLATTLIITIITLSWS